MKKTLVLITVILTVSIACKVKSKKETQVTDTRKVIESTSSVPEVVSNDTKTAGKVSHRYRASGCNTVIEVKLEGDEIQTLIPKDKLAVEIDVDGTEIYFTYNLLKMPQPSGCRIGQPAEINDVVKKN